MFLARWNCTKNVKIVYEAGKSHSFLKPNTLFLQEEAKNLKAKMREKVRPKMGKIDIDYQKLHDAFFKYQTKPKMTIHGDLYYEVNALRNIVIDTSWKHVKCAFISCINCMRY